MPSYIQISKIHIMWHCSFDEIEDKSIVYSAFFSLCWHCGVRKSLRNRRGSWKWVSGNMLCGRFFYIKLTYFWLEEEETWRNSKASIAYIIWAKRLILESGIFLLQGYPHEKVVEVVNHLIFMLWWRRRVWSKQRWLCVSISSLSRFTIIFVCTRIAHALLQFV